MLAKGNRIERAWPGYSSTTAVYNRGRRTAKTKQRRKLPRSTNHTVLLHWSAVLGRSRYNNQHRPRGNGKIQ